MLKSNLGMLKCNYVLKGDIRMNLKKTAGGKQWDLERFSVS